jgi:hypothetical protein
MDRLRVGFALLGGKRGLYSLKFHVPDNVARVMEGEGLVRGASVCNTGDAASGAVRVEVLLDEDVIHSEVMALAQGQADEVLFEVPRALVSGGYEVRMLASTAAGLQAEQAWTVQVAPDTIPPTVLLSGGGGMLEALVADKGTGPDPATLSCDGWEPPAGFAVSWRGDTLVARAQYPGARRTVWVQIADNRGNVGTSAPMELAPGIEAVEHVWCHPNPSSGETDFLLCDDGGGQVSVPELEVRLYTLSGTDIRRLSAHDTSRLHWDGEDAGGHPVANGVYLYRAEARDGNGGSVRSLGRLVVHR